MDPFVLKTGPSGEKVYYESSSRHIDKGVLQRQAVDSLHPVREIMGLMIHRVSHQRRQSRHSLLHQLSPAESASPSFELMGCPGDTCNLKSRVILTSQEGPVAGICAWNHLQDQSAFMASFWILR